MITLIRCLFQYNNDDNALNLRAIISIKSNEELNTLLNNAQGVVLDIEEELKRRGK